MINKSELILAIKMLEEYSEIMGNMICNDYYFPTSWSDSMKETFVSDFHDLNGDLEEMQPGETNIPNFCVAWTLARKLQKLLNAKIIPS